MDDFADSERATGLPEFLKDPRGIVRRRWPIMAIVLAAAALVAVPGVLTWPMRYEATAKLLLSSQRIPEDFVRSTISEGIDEQISAMVGELLSRDSLTEVVARQGLAPTGAPAEEVIAGVRRSITIEPETVFGYGGHQSAVVLAIRYLAADPDTAAAVANDLSDQFIASHVRRRNQQAKLTSEFLLQDLEREEEALREQRAAIAEFKKRYRGELPGELETTLARLERLQQQRQSLALQVSDAEGRLLLLQNQRAAADPRAKLLDELRTRLATERSVHTDEHPNVVALRGRVEALETELEMAGSDSDSSQGAAAELVVRREIASLRVQLAGVEREAREIDARVARIPAREEELAALEQREQVLRESSVQAHRKVKDAELAESLELAQQGLQVSRLETAAPPRDPKLPRWKLALGAIVAVLGAAAFAGVALEWLDRVVLVGADVEALTGMVNLGEVPKIS